MSRDYSPANRRNARQNNTRPRNSRVKPTRKTIPSWVWMLAGILIGTLVTGIFNSSKNNPQPTEAKPDAIQPANTATSSGQPGHKPRFDFYTLLKESEVVVPDENGNMPSAQPVIIPEPDKKPAATVADKQSAPEVETKAAPVNTSVPAATSVASQQPAQPQEQPTVAAPVEKPAPKPVVPAPAPAQESEVYVLQAGSFKDAADADSVRASLLLLNMHANIEKVSTANNVTWHRVLVGPFTNKTDLGNARAILTQNGIDSIQLKRRL